MAILLRAHILMDKKKFDEAIAELRDALVVHPANYALYEALVHAFLLQEKNQEVLILMNYLSSSKSALSLVLAAQFFQCFRFLTKK